METLTHCDTKKSIRINFAGEAMRRLHDVKGYWRVFLVSRLEQLQKMSPKELGLVPIGVIADSDSQNTKYRFRPVVVGPAEVRLADSKTERNLTVFANFEFAFWNSNEDDDDDPPHGGCRLLFFSKRDVKTALEACLAGTFPAQIIGIPKRSANNGNNGVIVVCLSASCIEQALCLGKLNAAALHDSWALHAAWVKEGETRGDEFGCSPGSATSVNHCMVISGGRTGQLTDGLLRIKGGWLMTRTRGGWSRMELPLAYLFGGGLPADCGYYVQATPSFARSRRLSGTLGEGKQRHLLLADAYRHHIPRVGLDVTAWFSSGVSNSIATVARTGDGWLDFALQGEVTTPTLH